VLLHKRSRPLINYVESKDQTERTVITQTLERNGFNRQRAAAELGISRMTLYKKLHKYELMGA